MVPLSSGCSVGVVCLESARSGGDGGEEVDDCVPVPREVAGCGGGRGGRGGMGSMSTLLLAVRATLPKTATSALEYSAESPR